MYRDDFNTFNKVHWKKFSHTFANNLANFNSGNSYIEKGKLILKVDKDSRAAKGISAAEIRSLQSFKYGKFTVRMKASATPGIVSAFFLYSPGKEPNPEIDIEFTGKNSGVVHFNHWIDEESHHKEIDLGFDASKDFHTYSIIWRANRIDWEVDGKIIYSVREFIPRQSLKLLLNTWPSKSSDWAGSLNLTDLPASCEIDYVQIENFR